MWVINKSIILLFVTLEFNKAIPCNQLLVFGVDFIFLYVSLVSFPIQYNCECYVVYIPSVE